MYVLLLFICNCESISISESYVIHQTKLSESIFIALEAKNFISLSLVALALAHTIIKIFNNNKKFLHTSTIVYFRS